MQQVDVRRNSILGFFGLLFFILLAQVFYLQVIDRDYRMASNSISVVEQTILPARGMIYDRYDSLMVYNSPVYDIYFAIRNVKDSAGICDLLSIEQDYLREKIAEAEEKGYYYKPYPLVRNLSESDFARIQEELYRHSELSVVTAAQRRYNGNNGALVLGFMGEVNDKDIEDSEKYYGLGDYRGKTGLEHFYEDSLRGIKGKKFILRDKHNVLHGSFNDGIRDVKALPGKNLHTTLSKELQAYGEKLMRNKVGSVVAIEPKTGEILALISSPTYDPNWLTSRNRSDYINALTQDTLKPMFNRAIMAEYPPGSTFKPMASLIALNDDAVNINFSFPCRGGYSLNRGKPGCHEHVRLRNMADAIRHSCNAYYAENFRRSLTHDKYDGDVRAALNHWAEDVKKFGYRTKFDLGIRGAQAGFFPDSDYYDKIYKGWNWGPMTIISLSIGQGETTATTLQMANATAMIANKGYYIEPHLVKSFDDEGNSTNVERVESGYTPSSFDYVIDGMERVYIDGTAAASKIDSIAACGKTGTAENPHGADHSIFVAFAPKDDPEIAIAVIVENSGYGSTYAAPIASLMMESYIKDSIAPRKSWIEQHMFDSDLTGRGDKDYLEAILEETKEENEENSSSNVE